MNRNRPKSRNLRIVQLFIILLLGLNLFASDSVYQLPCERIVEIFDRPLHPLVSVLHGQDKMMSYDLSIYIPLEWLAQEVVHYGEINIYSRSRSRPRVNFHSGIHVVDISSATKGLEETSFHSTRLDLPKNSAFGGGMPSFSGHALFTIEYLYDRMVLWHVDTSTYETRVLLDGGLTQVTNSVASWFPDNVNLLVSLIPENMEKPELASNVPTGPIIRETTGRESRIITRPNLIQDSHEEALFEYYATTQLGVLNTITGELRRIGSPGVITSTLVSPNSRFVLVHEHIKPFSKTVAYWHFPSRWYVYDLVENREIELVRHPQAVPQFGRVQTGKRWFSWHPLMDASLIYVEALDGGESNAPATYRDDIRLLNHPFRGNGRRLFRTAQRLQEISFIDRDTYILSEFEWRTNTTITTLVNSRNRRHQISRRHIRAIYDSPGSPVTYTTNRGQTLVLRQGNYIFFIGDGVSRDSRVPFVDKLNVNTFVRQRIVEFDEEDFVQILDFYNNNPERLLILRQNRTTPNNMFLVNLADNTEIALTQIVDNVPELTNLPTRVIRYMREDGVQLSGLLYLPANFDGSERIPLLMSAYPREFIDAATASQIVNQDNRFVRPFGSSNLYMCLDNVAVLVNAAFPIIGDTETANNTFIEQSIMNARAAIDYLYEEGIIDRDKVVISGHSYGAFMVLNMLAHSDLFAGGIAQNGAYNRTLTPFGFQSERRSLWQARDTYINLSPFLFANQIQAPLLLIHSTEDTNPGTFPLQSRRLFEALEGLGKTARYVQLPLEGHNYRARETHLHLLWEYQKFFDDFIR